MIKIMFPHAEGVDLNEIVMKYFKSLLVQTSTVCINKIVNVKVS